MRRTETHGLPRGALPDPLCSARQDELLEEMCKREVRPSCGFLTPELRSAAALLFATFGQLFELPFSAFLQAMSLLGMCGDGGLCSAPEAPPAAARAGARALMSQMWASSG